MVHLEVGASAAWRRQRDSYPDQDFIRLEGRGQHVDEEIGRLDDALSIGAACLDVRVERENHSWQVAGGIGVGQAATDSAAVADLQIADNRGALRQDR